MADCRRRRSFRLDGFRSKSRMALEELHTRSFRLMKSQPCLMGGAPLNGIYSSSPEHFPPPRYTLLSESRRRTINEEVLGETEEKGDIQGTKIRAEEAKRTPLWLALQPLATAAAAEVAVTKASTETGRENGRNREGEDAGDHGKKYGKLNIPPEKR